MAETLPVPIGGASLVAVEDAELAAAHGYALAEKAAATRAAYRRDADHFAAWCAERQLVALPAHEATVVRYLSGLADAGMAVSTIDRRAAAIAYAHKLADEEPPTNKEVVKAVQRGIRRRLGVRPSRKAPLTADMVVDVLKHVPKAGLPGLRDRAVLLLGFAAALRRSELVALDVADLEATREGLFVHIRSSKTDQEGAGARIPVPKGSKLRPVKAVADWLEAAAIVDGPVFRRLWKGGRLSDLRLTGRSVADLVKNYAGAAGYDADDFAGHSLRAGFATSALDDGADLLRVMDITRHKEVRTLKIYDRRSAWRGHAGGGFL